KTLAISCQTLPNLAESRQTMPPEEPRPEPGATNLKPAEFKEADLKPDELKPNQQRALLEAPSVAAAARESRIGERTIHRWLDDLEEAAEDNPPKEPEPIFDRTLLEDDESEAA
ncbi:MAG: hypothetical protein WD733_00700, partial [Bryobacterales bacterium]